MPIDLKPLDAETAITEMPAQQGPSLQINQFTDAIKSLGVQKDAASQAATDALKANETLQRQYLQQNDALLDDSLKAYENLQKVQQLGMGGDNAVTRFWGMFDENYNAPLQHSRIQVNQIKSQQLGQRTQAQIEINNQLPALRAAEAKGAEEQLKLQESALDIQAKFIGLEQKDVELKYKKAELSIALRKEQRDGIEFALKGMGLNEAKQQLKLASQGKGDWVGAEGFLEDRIHSEMKVEAEFTKLQQEIAKGNIELITAQEKRAADSIPVAQAQQLVAQAQAKGQSYVQVGKVQLPVATVSEALKKNLEVDTAIRTSVMASESGKIDDDYRTLTQTASTLAANGNPVSMRTFGQLVRARGQFDPNNPDAYLQQRAVLNDAKKQLDEQIKSAASTQDTPEGKAGVQKYFETGTFDLAGSSAVVAGAAGKLSSAFGKTKYGEAWDAVTNAYAAKIAERNPKLPDFKAGSAANSQAFLAMALQKESKDDLKTTRELVLADPVVRSAVKDQITGYNHIDAIDGALAQLTHGPAVVPVLAQLQKNPALYKNQDGSIAFDKLTEFLESQSLVEQYKVDYTQLVGDAISRYATAADRQFDPSKTLEDKALEFQIFNMDPTKLLRMDAARELRIKGQAVRAQKQKALQQDRAGVTQQKAFEEVIKSMPEGMSTQDLMEQATHAAATVPSATGTGKPANTMRNLYSGGR